MAPTRLATPIVALLLAGTALAADYGRLNPDAPAQTAQFEFILGAWNCKTRFMGPDGNYREGEATWTGYYVLDGWAIKDDWHSVAPDGTEFRGFNIRSFNTETGKWDNRWLPQVTLQWKYYESEQVGDTMVMTGGEGTDGQGTYVDRNTFYDIAAEHWKWRKDRSYDGGETWSEGVGYIEATRVRD